LPVGCADCRFASADDALFDQLPSVASPTHAVPNDLIAGAQTVIAFFLPFPKSLTRTNIKKRNSSVAWDFAYIETNDMTEAAGNVSSDA
jgi:hypothetical protein